MLMHGHTIFYGPTIFHALDYRSVSTFLYSIASHDTVQKTFPFLFCRWSSSSHVTKRRLTSLGFNSYGNQCPCFWIIPNTFKRFETVDSSTCNVFPCSANVWDRSSSSISSNYLSSNLFRCVRTFFSHKFKIIFWSVETSLCMSYSTEYCHHKSQQEFYVLQLQICFG